MHTLIKKILSTITNRIMEKAILPVIMLRSVFCARHRKEINIGNDPIRYASLYLAIQCIKDEFIPGALAECGVWQGVTSRFLHHQMPERKLYLFDTFEGFDARDGATDSRFKNTSLDLVKKRVGDSQNVIIKKGFFPESATGLDHEIFAFVLLDFDKYESTLAALRFFYPKVQPGGYIVIHDYNNPESDWSCSRATKIFLKNKPERVIAIPDAWGSVIFRKFQ